MDNKMHVEAIRMLVNDLGGGAMFSSMLAGVLDEQTMDLFKKNQRICIKQSRGYEKSDWNLRFQSICDEKSDTVRFEKLASLRQEFIECAESYGKIIIVEKFLPIYEKTVKPLSIGGVAGKKCSFSFICISYSPRWPKVSLSKYSLQVCSRC